MVTAPPWRPRTASRACISIARIPRRSRRPAWPAACRPCGGGRGGEAWGGVVKEAGLGGWAWEAGRMIQQGAVEVDHQRVTSTDETLAPGKEYLIQVGKRRFKRVLLEGPRV